MKAVVAVPVSIVLTIAALFASLPPPAAAQTQAAERVAFKGKASGVVTATGFLQPIATSMVVGEGEATHLGRFTVTAYVAVDVTTGIPRGSWTLTAPNGDMLFLAMGGHGIDSTHGYGEFAVVGGTGRFRGAIGSYTQLITFAVPLGSSPTIAYTDTMEGTIYLPGSKP